MGLTKPTADARIISTGVDNALCGGGGDGFTFACWAMFNVAYATSATLFFNRATGVRGVWVRFLSATSFGMTYINSASGNQSPGHLNTIVNGECGFWLVGVDTSGNTAIRTDASETTSSTGSLKVTGNVVATSLLASAAGANPTRAKIMGAMVWNRLLTAAERQTLYASGGTVIPTAGLVSNLPLFDAPPGVDTGTTVPVDVANPDRVWATSGVGDEYTWQSADHPTRRRHQ